MNTETLYSALCDPTSLLRELRYIVSNDSNLESMARRSYRHQNGHCKLVLYDEGRQTPAVRIHIWDPPPVDSPSDIHSHPWGFSSRIVAGSLLNVIYEVTAVQNGETEMFEYAVHMGDRHHTGHHLQHLGQTALRETGRYYLPSGSQYGFAAGIIHQVVPGRTGAMSIFLQQPFERVESRLFRAQEQAAASIRVSLLSASEIAKAIEKAILRLTNCEAEETDDASIWSS